MRPLAACVLGLLLAWPVLADQDKPKDQTPAQQYQALIQEYGNAQQAFFKAYQEAKTQEDRQKVLREKQPSADACAARFLALAEKHPKDPVAVDALVWVVSNVYAARTAKDSPRAKAVALLLRDHTASAKLGRVCQTLANSWNDKDAEALLRGVLAKNPNKEAQGEACLALAQLLAQKAAAARQLKDPSLAAPYAQYYGKEAIEELKKLDLGKLDAEDQQLYQQFADKYLPGLEANRVAMVIQGLGNGSDQGGELVLRKLLDRDAGANRRDIQGQACLALAESLKRRAEALSDGDAKGAEKLQKESEQLLKRTVEKYGDVRAGFRGTVGEQAKAQLFELRFLANGKPAPEVEAEDLDGQKFKLSDYKGKVVLLDFWGNW
jgi:hypothetical protein